MSVTLSRRSQGPAGQDFNGPSDFPDLSADGLFVVFSSEASNAFLADGNGVVDLWRQNRASGALERVSLNTAGQATDGASFGAAISGDGRYVAFTSLATNLTLGDSNGFPDVFRRDMDTGATLLVSAAPDGLPANSISFAPAISADGRYVAFLSAATNLVGNDQNFSIDVFRRDMVTGITLLVSTAADGSQASSGAINRPSISADGRYVAFDSAAANLTANDANNRDDVFVKDMQTGAIRRASEGANGEAMAGTLEGFLRPAISADGRYVVFSTAAGNLVAGDSNGVADVFRKDLQTGAIIRVSTDAAGTQGNAESRDADISADGRYVTFTSLASNFVPGDLALSADIFRRDMQTGALLLISRTAEGGTGFGQSVNAAISSDGATLAFASTAPDLVSPDGNALQDVFAATIGAPAGTQTGTAGADSLVGGEGADRLFGLAGADTLQGLAGNDWLDGAEGDDILLAGTGSDAMLGGDGNDTYEVESAGDVVVELEDGGTDTVSVAYSGYVLPANIEIALLQGLANAMTGGEGSELLYGHLGLASSIDGAAGDDTLIGAAMADSLQGGPGDDYLRGGGGANSLLGGPGDDLAEIDQPGDSFIELVGEGTDTALITLQGWTLPEHVEIGRLYGLASILLGGGAVGQLLVANPGLASLLAAGGGDDELLGSSFADNLAGGAGRDTLRGGEGQDFMQGGAGDDTYEVGQAGDVVLELAGEGYDTALVTAALYRLAAQVELGMLGGSAAVLYGADTGQALVANPGLASQLVAGAGDDELRGSPLADNLAGGAGRDTLRGGEGQDFMQGGAGDDTYEVGQAGDVVLELAGEGYDTALVTAALYRLAAQVEVGFLQGQASVLYGADTGQALVANPALASQLEAGAGDDELWGSALADNLGGGAGRDTLRGGGGDDYMRGAAGDDTYFIEQAGDVILEMPGEGYDTAYVTAAIHRLAAEVEVGYLLAGASMLYGSDSGQMLVANPSLASLLSGGQGDDQLFGSAFADRLEGGGGRDLFNPGAGDDDLRGGQGDDSYVVEQLGDTILELPGEGYDTAYVLVDGYTLAAGIELGYLSGTATRLQGSADGESLIANPVLGGQLAGQAGADTLYGSIAADFLAGGSGDDLLWGFAGADRFVFDLAGWGNDWAMDFNRAEGDLLDFRGSGVTGLGQFTRFHDAAAGNLILSWDGNAVTLRGVADVFASDFLF